MPEEAPLANNDASTAPPSPATDDRQSGGLRAAVTRIWSVQLGVDDIDPDDDFFDLGGHSLHALEIIARVEEVLGVELSLGELYGTPTINGVIGCIGRTTAAESGEGALAETDGGGWHGG